MGTPHQSLVSALSAFCCCCVTMTIESRDESHRYSRHAMLCGFTTTTFLYYFPSQIVTLKSASKQTKGLRACLNAALESKRFTIPGELVEL